MERKYKKRNDDSLNERNITMKLENRLFIGGEWVKGVKKIRVLNPADGNVVAEVEAADAGLVSRAVEAAKTSYAKGEWAKMLPRARAAVLRKAAEIIASRLDEFAEVETLNTGKPLKESKAIDIASMIDTLQFYAGISDVLDGSQVPVGDGMVDFTRREPLGVVGLITPWNFPGVLAIRKLAPALMAGNSVVLKPASLTPLTTLMLGEVFTQAGLPKGVLNIVNGSGGEVGDVLMNHPAIHKISFTGSAEIGAKVMAGCSAELKASCMELGGKSPAIVCADADIEKAIDGVLFGAFLNQGQCCCAATRLLVDRTIAKEFMSRFVKAVDEKIVIGQPMDAKTTMGPLISKSHREQVLGYVERAKKEGAEVIYQSKLSEKLPADGNWCSAVVVKASSTMEIYRQEVFGPVLTVTEFEGVDALIAAGNDTEYGLAASIFTESMSTAERAIRELEAGTVWVNCHNFVFNNAPYGGMKRSGVGRECGVEGLLAYTQTKNVIWYAAKDGFKWY
jgi:acyl-CoA reductase-like NAD-dependent aldehyde dehydrogenase